MAASRKPFDAAGMSEDAKKAFTAAFEALSGWRSEMADIAERNGTDVFDKMGDAAKAMGWPSEFVDMTRQQMQQGTKMQMQMMDQVMDAWERQMKSPTASFKMPEMPGMMGIGSPSGMPPFPNFDMGAMGGSPMAPLQFWMQAAEMWQKSWQQALTSWMDAQSKMAGMSGGSSKPGSSRDR